MLISIKLKYWLCLFLAKAKFWLRSVRYHRLLNLIRVEIARAKLAAEVLSLWYKSEREVYLFDQQEYVLDPAQRERVARDNNLDVDLCDLS